MLLEQRVYLHQSPSMKAGKQGTWFHSARFYSFSTIIYGKRQSGLMMMWFCRSRVGTVHQLCGKRGFFYFSAANDFEFCGYSFLPKNAAETAAPQSNERTHVGRTDERRCIIQDGAVLTDAIRCALRGGG